MAKRKHKHEEHVDESWLVPYADVLTLLLALFIVLFAMSSVDAGKFKQMALTMNSELKGGTGDEEFLSAIDSKIEQDAADKEMALEKLIEEKAQQLLDEKKEEILSSEMENLKQIQDDIEKYIEANNLKLSLKTTLTEKGLMVTILDNVLFASGKAVVKSDSIPLAHEIANLLEATMPREIMVSGHTDIVPMNSLEFSSNWSLSTQRSVNFLEIMLKNKKLDPRRFSATGHGEFMPVAENTTKVGKSKNRRVEVLILPLTTKINTNLKE